MKKNRFKNTKEKMKKFFIKLKNKDTSFLIIVLCVLLLSTALIWRYTSNKANEGENLAEETPNEEGNINANVDPYEDYVQDIMDEYGKAKDEEESKPETKQDSEKMNVPLEGEVIKEFTLDNLLYFDAIGEWKVHNGVDIKSTETLLIESAFAGTVEKVSQSELTGIEIIIDHGNNIKTLYNNLSSSKVSVGDTVTKGQVIGNIGNVSSIESADGPHLHFEVLLDGKNVNPLDYFPAE
ncbi:MAG: M23 family metallopeptidase [Tissierellia bacterium]|nr:M23 family metallopeptidase [Tissierellia bacterium]